MEGPRTVGHYATFFTWHIEGGKGTKGKVVHFHLPHPLAR
jgi:hypothetical protein